MEKIEYEEGGPTLNAIKSFASACKNIGWEKQLKDLTAIEVMALIYTIQESGNIKYGANVEQIKELEEVYESWTGRKSPSAGIPF